MRQDDMVRTSAPSRVRWNYQWKYEPIQRRTCVAQTVLLPPPPAPSLFGDEHGNTSSETRARHEQPRHFFVVDVHGDLHQDWQVHVIATRHGALVCDVRSTATLRVGSTGIGWDAVDPVPPASPAGHLAGHLSGT